MLILLPLPFLRQSSRCSPLGGKGNARGRPATDGVSVTSFKAHRSRQLLNQAGNSKGCPVPTLTPPHVKQNHRAGCTGRTT